MIARDYSCRQEGYRPRARHRRRPLRRLAGPAARGVIGLDVPWDEHVSLVGEAILSWAYVDADLTGGDSVHARLWVPQLSLGISLRD